MAEHQFSLPPGAKVYSYSRCSKPEQLRGDTRRRQLKMSEDWCKRHGLELDNTLRLDDYGKSAFKGKNATHGRLGVFLKALDEGRIVAGSILLVESLDRLSRNDIDEALSLFLGILRKGVTIVTLNPEDVFEPKSKSDLVKIIIVLVIMSRAYEESATKSKRIKEAYQGKRDGARNGEKMVGQKPRWIDSKGKPIPAAVKAIKKIFELKRKRYGYGRIAKTLNNGAYWQPNADGWKESYIRHRVINDRRVIGECQLYVMVDGKRVPDGEPLTNQFDSIIDRNIFDEVQAMGQGSKGGQIGKFSNVLRSLVRCAYCGGPMHFTTKGAHRRILYCPDRKRNAASAIACIDEPRTIKYDDCIQTLLENCPKLRPRDILPSRDDHDRHIASLHEEIRSLREAVADNARRTERLNNNLGDDLPPSSIANVKKQLNDLDLERATKEPLLARAEERLKEATREPRDFSKWQADAAELLRQCKGDGNAALRERLNDHLHEFIKRIEIFAAGYTKEYDPDAEQAAIEKLAASDEGKKLLATLTNRNGKTNGRTYASARVAASLQLHPSVVSAAGDTFRETVEVIAAEYFPKLLRDKKFRALVDDVAKRRLTPEAKFLRVHFKSGAVVDMVPAKSLASGSALIKDNEGKRIWQSVSPELDMLWRKQRF